MAKDKDIHIRLEPGLLRDLHRVAILDRRKPSDWIRLALEEAIQRRIASNGKTTHRGAI